MTKRKEGYPEIDVSKDVEREPGSERTRVEHGACPRCGQRRSFVKDENLKADTMADGERIVITHLQGIRCTNCSEFALDPESARLVEEILVKSNRPFVKFKRKISMIGKRPAIYLPKDLLESLGIRRGMEVLIYPRTHRSVVVEFS